MAGKLVVVGAGLMGSGIAQVAAQSGWQVTVQDVGEPQLVRALAAVESSYRRLAAKGKIEPAAVDESLARITTTTDLEVVADADLVVEAVFESLEVKLDLFHRLDRLCPQGAVLASNTSALPITQLAAATERPESVVGTHFFSPVPLMALCELVRGFKTSDQTLARARQFAESVGKTCIVVNRDVAGFVTTRLIVALSMEAAKLVEAGVATPEDVDAACRLGFGHAMGPLQTMDLTGVDIMVNAAKNIHRDTADPKFSPPELLLRMVAAGDLGRKTGRGFYNHEP